MITTIKQLVNISKNAIPAELKSQVEFQYFTVSEYESGLALVLFYAYPASGKLPSFSITLLFPTDQFLKMDEDLASLEEHLLSVAEGVIRQRTGLDQPPLSKEL